MEKDRKQNRRPDHVFEVSWEVCNKLGGIHTVVSTKAPLMQATYAESYLLIGPDLNKGTDGNLEFIEDQELLKPWREQFDIDGIKFRVGHWNIPGRPIAVLIDFSPLFVKKDEIFSELWNKNRLDSLRGGWNYIEPALFGYAVGKVIENFKTFYLNQDHLVVAHFHEWLASTGILYLENTVPEIATVFTTHATVTGRALCGHGEPFYSRFDTYNGDQVARDFEMVSLHSLEKTAALTADAFTTVSDNTARECQQLLGKAVDRVATNGFDDSFIPLEEQFDDKRAEARKKLLEVASAVMGYPAKEDSLLVATSGRYEYRNKGIDIFIDALAALNEKKNVARETIAFVLVPAAHTSARPEVVESLKTGKPDRSKEPAVLTHHLQDPEHDSILRQIKLRGLTNAIEHTTKIIFAPIYLDGRDGVFDMAYYDILIGLHLTVFPSYYEPFGYTPLESLAFKVPTVTTTLTGFGVQVKSSSDDYEEGMSVIERSDFNDETVTDQIANIIYEFSNMDGAEIARTRKKAFEISRSFLWKNLIENYEEVYQLALERFAKRSSALERILEMPPVTYLEPAESNEPIWKSAMVRFKVPEPLKDLETLSRNLWWTWHPEAGALFASIDAQLWEKTNHNPIALLGSLSHTRYIALSNDADFIAELHRVIEKFNAYMLGAPKKGPKIAYLCMEYGLHESLTLYSGGLGILAGDYLKEASDRHVDMVAFGLLYRYGYFKQGLSPDGDQVVHYEKQHFTQLPIRPVNDADGNRLKLQLPLRGPLIRVQVWSVNVGRVKLYLFDTDIPENSDENKKITYHLYGADSEYRFRQELLIAVNTIQLLEFLETTPDIFHYNEGHTAFTSLIRVIELVAQKNMSFEEAGLFVKASTLFTTHTPVPAGHDLFGEDLLRSYQSHFADTLNVPWERFLGLGKINPTDQNEKFSMTHLAARMAGEINGVSKIHGEVTRKMLRPIWKGFLEEELGIGYVTNGVHYATWAASLWQQLFTKTLGSKFDEDVSNPEFWAKVNEIENQQIASIKKSLKKELIRGIRQRLKSEMDDLYPNPLLGYEASGSLKETDMIICFARRFATYKRANLLFTNLERVSKLVNDPQKPVKFIFAGKAHPADKGGQDMIKNIVEISRRPEFLGKIIFVQNYDMALARLLVQGADVWLNTPERKNEASGTSGMKAALNGTLNCSVLDGWWAEAYREDAGWALPQEPTFHDSAHQYNLDAMTLYNLLEQEVIPEFFDLDKTGVSAKWIARIKNSFIHIAPRFVTCRMLLEYQQHYYSKMYENVQNLRANNYATTKEMIAWTKKINAEWTGISVVDVRVSDGKKPLDLGDVFKAEVVLNLNGLTPSDIGVELVFAKRGEDGSYYVRNVRELKLIGEHKNRATFQGEAVASLSGAFQYDIRIFPKHPRLRHRRNLPLVKWI